MPPMTDPLQPAAASGSVETTDDPGRVIVITEDGAFIATTHVPMHSGDVAMIRRTPEGTYYVSTSIPFGES